MSRFLLTSATLALLTLALAGPAQAYIIAAQLQLLNGSTAPVGCPATLQFNVQVIGTPMTPYKYRADIAIDGVKKTTEKLVRLMPSVGVDSFTYSVVVPSTSDTTKDNSLVLGAAGLDQPDAIPSNYASFSVNCTKRPPASQSMGKAPEPIFLAPGIIGQMHFAGPPAPSGLQSTLDPHVCTDHAGFFGGLVCAAAIPAGHLVLLWNYAPSPGFESLDGYRVYRVDGGAKTLALTQGNGIDVKIATFDAVTSSLNGQCFAVSAYKGPSESAASAPFCVGRGSTTQTISLPAVQRRSARMSKFSSSGLASAGFGHPSNLESAQAISVGYRSTTYRHVTGDDYINEASRTGLFFDTAALKGRSVYRAALKLHVLTTRIGSSGDLSDSSLSCATNVGLASNAWWADTGWINAVFTGGIEPGRVTGPDISIDVTKLVADWVSGRVDNYGLVLKGDSEDMSAFRDDACLSTYADPTLEVTSF